MKRLNARGATHLVLPIIVVVVVAAIGTYLLVASHADTPCVGRVFRQGSSGICVRDIQGMLNENSVHKVTITSYFNLRTKQAVKGFQTDRNLPATGVVNRATWRQLCLPVGGHYNYKYYKTAGCNTPPPYR